MLLEDTESAESAYFPFCWPLSLGEANVGRPRFVRNVRMGETALPTVSTGTSDAAERHTEQEQQVQHNDAHARRAFCLWILLHFTEERTLVAVP